MVSLCGVLLLMNVNTYCLGITECRKWLKTVNTAVYTVSKKKCVHNVMKDIYGYTHCGTKM
jgi:hypothetical protein